MTTKEDSTTRFSIDQTIKFKSGLNMGYLLGLSHDGDEILNSIHNIGIRNRHLAFCRGLTKGMEMARLDRSQKKNFERVQRMDSLQKIQKGKSKDKDLER